jgi:hypothetical protein
MTPLGLTPHFAPRRRYEHAIIAAVCIAQNNERRFSSQVFKCGGGINQSLSK